MEVPKKQLGQHWLNDQPSLLAMADAAEVETGDLVLEIGPGLGSLTNILIHRGSQVWAVELDTNLAKKLPNLVTDLEKLKIINQDILKFDFSQIPTSYKISANIPYYLTSHLLRLLSETNNPPTIAALLVQKEVAQRVCAKSGNMSLLSVSTQMYFEATLGQVVPARLFTPPPKIDSQILILKRRKKPLFGKQDSKLLFQVIKAGFSERRKKLRSSLSGGLNISKEQADTIFEEAKIDGNLRAQSLSLKNWLDLAKTWQNTKV